MWDTQVLLTLHQPEYQTDHATPSIPQPSRPSSSLCLVHLHFDKGLAFHNILVFSLFIARLLTQVFPYWRKLSTSFFVYQLSFHLNRSLSTTPAQCSHSLFLFAFDLIICHLYTSLRCFPFLSLLSRFLLAFVTFSWLNLPPRPNGEAVPSIKFSRIVLRSVREHHRNATTSLFIVVGRGRVLSASWTTLREWDSTQSGSLQCELVIRFGCNSDS